MNLTSKRDELKKVYTPIGSAVARMGVPPNFITLLSLFLGTASAYFFYQGKLLTAVLFLFMSGLFDLLDGVVARTNEKASKFGAVFDWIADKWVDGFVLGAIGFAYGSPLTAITVVVVSMLHSFIKPVVYAEIGFSERIKGKIKDPLEGVGFFGRPETHLSVMFFALLERFNLPLGLEFGIRLITILTLASLLLRVLYLYKHYSKEFE